MDTRLMLDGLKAMVLGMGMVYTFLVVMIFLMKIMSKLLAPYSKFLVKESPKKAGKAGGASAGKKVLSAGDRLLAQAAIAAVRMHRGE